MRRWRLPLKWLWRDLRAGELGVTALAVVLATAAMCSVGLLTRSVERALHRGAGELLAADLILRSDRELPAPLLEAPRRHGLTQALTLTFPSMLQTDAHAQLSTVKAVSPGYPLRGQLQVHTAAGVERIGHGPPRGTVWVDEKLASLLELHLGERVTLGDSDLTVDGIVLSEPDASADFSALLPRVMVNADDLPASGLLQPGSRIQYRLQVAGEPDQVKAFRDDVTPMLEHGQHLEGLDEARPELGMALERAGRFLRLAALMSVLLAAAMFLAIRRYVERHRSAVAVLRTFGASQSQVLEVFLRQLAVLGIVGIVLGIVLGGLGHLLLVAALGTTFGSGLPSPGARPVLEAAAAGAVLLVAFCVPPLWQLKGVPPLRVLRHDVGDAGLDRPSGIAAVLAPAALVAWQAGEVRLAIVVVLGLAAVIGLGALAALGLIRLAPRLARGRGIGVRFGLENLARRRGLSVIQVVSLSLGLLALMLLTVIRSDLLSAWNKSIPADAPNHFAINIQPVQRAEIVKAFTAAGLEAPEIKPMVRGRLVAISGQPVVPEHYPDVEARRLAEREFNLSWNEDADSSAPGWRVETRLAEKLGIHPGDVLAYEIDGHRYEAPVLSLRTVNWDSFQPNFYVIGNAALLKDQPASYITSFRLGADRAAFSTQLVRAFPNLSVIDVSGIIGEVRGLIDQVARVVELVFFFSLLSGGLVLYAATLATHDERKRDVAVLRVLGAPKRVVERAATAELTALGALAGLLAASTAVVVGVVVAKLLLSLTPVVSIWLIPVGVLLGAASARLAASPLLRRALRTPPRHALGE